MPGYCPMGADGSLCCVKGHGRRERQTGPCHELVVAKCTTHGGFFTLYPHGFEPYGRRKVAPEGGLGERWRDTIFEAALVAAAGEAGWPRDFDGGPGWWTQRRQIEWTARRLGLVSEGREAERVAHVLGVGVGVHARARREYGSATGYRARARAVVRVLGAVVADGVVGRVYAAGHIVGGAAPWMWRRRGYVTAFH